MKNKNLEAFKAKANAVLLDEALLSINGGMDAEACHPDPNKKTSYGYLKAELGFSSVDVDKFFARPDLADKFNNWYAQGDERAAEERMAWFSSVVADCPPSN